VRAKPKQLGTDDARARVRKRFGDAWEPFIVDAENFHRCLRSPEERTAYMAEFPDQYFDDVCGFIHSPASLFTGLSTETEAEGCFRRFHFEAYLRRYCPPLFELPDLSAYAPEESRGYDHEAGGAFFKLLQTERAKWFVSCGLALSDNERAWLSDLLSGSCIDKPTRDLLLKASACPVDTWEAEHVPANWKYHPPWREDFARLLQEARERLAAQPDRERSPGRAGPRLVVQ